MTREEEILNAAREYNNGITLSSPSNVLHFEAGAKWADTHSKSPWMSTENELPTKGGHYLCMEKNHHISTLAFCGDRWVNTSALFDVSLEVVKYWMPIPNLPEE